MSGSGREAFSENGRPVWMSGSGRETLSDVQEWSGGPPGCPGVVGRPSQRPGGPSGCPGVVERPSRLSGSGRETLPNVPA